MHRSPLTATLATALLAASTGCYHLGAKDVFEVSFAPVPATTLAALSDAHHRLRALEIPGAPGSSAYWDDGDGARGVLLFFTGNGYGAESAMRSLLIPARALGLDLVAFNYYDTGRTRPTLTEMRRIGDSLFDAAARLPTPAARRIYIGGHSLGATFALMTAADRQARGVFVAAPVSTGVAMLHHQLWYSRLVWLRPDREYAQFDNVAIAPHVHVPALIVGSTGDRDLPPPFTHEVFAALPDSTKREVILQGVAHSEYLSREAFWRAVSEFFALPASGPLAGYLRAK